MGIIYKKSHLVQTFKDVLAAVVLTVEHLNKKFLILLQRLQL